MSHFLEDPRFPACPSFGFTSEPMYSVQIVQTAGGRERRNRNWSRPLCRITATAGPRAEADIQELLEFWHVVGGTAVGFRFKDSTDWKSCRVQDTPLRTDQPLVLISGSIYQLTKRYDVGGAITQDRDIYKPVDDTILIADAGTLKTEGVHYDIDYTTGQVDLNFSPVGALTWGGEFDIPARFDSEFPVEIVNHRIESVAFVLRELRYEPESEET